MDLRCGRSIFDVPNVPLYRTRFQEEISDEHPILYHTFFRFQARFRKKRDGECRSGLSLAEQDGLILDNAVEYALARVLAIAELKLWMLRRYMWKAERMKSMSRYALFDRNGIRLESVDYRSHELSWMACSPLEPPREPFRHSEFPELIAAIASAREAGCPVVMMIGGHPIKLGLSRFLIDLIDRRLITLLATNGAGIIHDFELASTGGTSEDVAKSIKLGQFGLWTETGRLNDIAVEATRRNEGFAEAVGRRIEQESFPHRQLSISAAGWRTGIPITCHVSIGSDIIHSLPNCDGAAIGQASYTDFLIFARAIQELDGGVFLNVGSCVTGPEVFLKALSMARNVAHQNGSSIERFTTAVFDLASLPGNWRDGTPSKDDPRYYYRPWKTLLVRSVADGGTSYYFCGDHRQTIPTLWHELVNRSR